MLPAGHQLDSSKPHDLPLRSQAQVAKNTWIWKTMVGEKEK